MPWMLQTEEGRIRAEKKKQMSLARAAKKVCIAAVTAVQHYDCISCINLMVDNVWLVS